MEKSTLLGGREGEERKDIWEINFLFKLQYRGQRGLWGWGSFFLTVIRGEGAIILANTAR